MVGAGADLVVDCVCYSAADAELLVPLAKDVASLVMISSKAVYVDRFGRHSNSVESPHFDGPILETSPTVPPGDDSVEGSDWYARNKVAAERVLLESGMPVTIVRASKVHGVGAARPREWHFVKRVLDARRHVLLRYGGDSIDHPTAAVNLAALVQVAADKPGQRILNSADPDAPSVRDLSRAITAVLSHEWSEELLGSEAPANLGRTPWDAEFPIVLDTTASLQLGYRPVGTYDETVRAEVQWLCDIALTDGEVGLPAPFDHEFFADFFDYDAEDRYLASHD
jgi:nucleoside-diphosphate-sugar epimerase